MKCMIIRKADPDTEAGKTPPEGLMLAMAKYNERLVNAGVMVDGAGLKPSQFGARIKFDAGKALVIDGPFTETKDLLAGYTMLETETFAEALDWAKQWPPEDGNGCAELEVRPLLGMEDFAPDPGMAAHLQNADKLARRPVAITAYLTFSSGKCREAFNFYAQALGGVVSEMITWGDMGMAERMPPERLLQVAHATLKLGKLSVAGVDNTPDETQGVKPGSILLGFASIAQTQAAFSALIEGGSATLTPQATPWSSCFAMLTDQFDVSWLLNCEQPVA